MKKILFAALALIVVMASCVKDPKYPGVTISNVSYAPTAVQADDPVTVTATITSFNEFKANLVYTIEENAPVTIEMTDGTEEGMFVGVIPGQEDGVKVSFYVEAEGELYTKSSVMEYVVGAVAIDYSKLRLNELNGNDKFIEIFNAGSEAINMKGVYIEKDNEQKWVADNTVSLEAGGYLLLYSNKEEVVALHPDHPENLLFDGGLSEKKPVRVQLFTPDGTSLDDFNLVECVVPAPASYSRNADGLWYHAPATPGAANEEGTELVEGLEGGVTPPPTPEEPDYGLLVLNELNGNDKFIEIYNANPVAISLEGVYIEKDNEQKWIGDNTIVMEPDSYIVLYSNKEEVVALHPDHPENLLFDGGLSEKKPVRVQLFDPSGNSLGDFNLVTCVIPAPASYSRNSDGNWYHAEATPGAPNVDGTDPVEGLE